jgi:hypothetical protein
MGNCIAPEILFSFPEGQKLCVVATSQHAKTQQSRQAFGHPEINFYVRQAGKQRLHVQQAGVLFSTMVTKNHKGHRPTIIPRSLKPAAEKREKSRTKKQSVDLDLGINPSLSFGLARETVESAHQSAALNNVWGPGRRLMSSFDCLTSQAKVQRRADAKIQVD